MPNDPVKYTLGETVDNDFADYVCDTDANHSSAITASLEKFFGINRKYPTDKTQSSFGLIGAQSREVPLMLFILQGSAFDSNACRTFPSSG